MRNAGAALRLRTTLVPTPLFINRTPTGEHCSPLHFPETHHTPDFSGVSFNHLPYLPLLSGEVPELVEGGEVRIP